MFCLRSAWLEGLPQLVNYFRGLCLGQKIALAVSRVLVDIKAIVTDFLGTNPDGLDFAKLLLLSCFDEVHWRTLT